MLLPSGNLTLLLRGILCWTMIVVSDIEQASIGYGQSSDHGNYCYAALHSDYLLYRSEVNTRSTFSMELIHQFTHDAHRFSIQTRFQYPRSFWMTGFSQILCVCHMWAMKSLHSTMVKLHVRGRCLDLSVWAGATL